MVMSCGLHWALVKIRHNLTRPTATLELALNWTVVGVPVCQVDFHMPFPDPYVTWSVAVQLDLIGPARMMIRFSMPLAAVDAIGNLAPLDQTSGFLRLILGSVPAIIR